MRITIQIFLLQKHFYNETIYVPYPYTDSFLILSGPIPLIRTLPIPFDLIEVLDL